MLVYYLLKIDCIHQLSFYPFFVASSYSIAFSIRKTDTRSLWKHEKLSKNIKSVDSLWTKRKMSWGTRRIDVRMRRWKRMKNVHSFRCLFILFFFFLFMSFSTFFLKRNDFFFLINFNFVYFSSSNDIRVAAWIETFCKSDWNYFKLVDSQIRWRYVPQGRHLGLKIGRRIFDKTVLNSWSFKRTFYGPA